MTKLDIARDLNSRNLDDLRLTALKNYAKQLELTKDRIREYGSLTLKCTWAKAIAEACQTEIQIALDEASPIKKADVIAQFRAAGTSEADLKKLEEANPTPEILAMCSGVLEMVCPEQIANIPVGLHLTIQRVAG